MRYDLNNCKRLFLLALILPAAFVASVSSSYAADMKGILQQSSGSKMEQYYDNGSATQPVIDSSNSSGSASQSKTSVVAQDKAHLIVTGDNTPDLFYQPYDYVYDAPQQARAVTVLMVIPLNPL